MWATTLKNALKVLVFGVETATNARQLELARVGAAIRTTHCASAFSNACF